MPYSANLRGAELPRLHNITERWI